MQTLELAAKRGVQEDDLKMTYICKIGDIQKYEMVKITSLLPMN